MPSARRSGARSKTVTSIPRRQSAIAAARPPMPPPTMPTRAMHRARCQCPRVRFNQAAHESSESGSQIAVSASRGRRRNAIARSDCVRVYRHPTLHMGPRRGTDAAVAPWMRAAAILHASCSARSSVPSAACLEHEGTDGTGSAPVTAWRRHSQRALRLLGRRSPSSASPTSRRTGRVRPRAKTLPSSIGR
jgi:hypothetical protein